MFALSPNDAADWQLLCQVCGEDEEFFELQTRLLDIELAFCGMTRRAGIYEKLEDRLRAGQFENEQAALQIRRDEERRRQEAEEIEVETSLVQLVTSKPVKPIKVQRALFEECEAEE